MGTIFREFGMTHSYFGGNEIEQIQEKLFTSNTELSHVYVKLGNTTNQTMHAYIGFSSHLICGN